MNNTPSRRWASGAILLASLRRRCIRVGLAVAIAAAASIGAATPALAASSMFSYSPVYQNFTVPTGVTSLRFDVIGGAGADGQGTYGGGSGGAGAEVAGNMAVTPGEILTLWVGGAGQPDGAPGYGNPSHNDFEGGSGGSAGLATTGNGGGGGAASYILAGSNMAALAGGGGGGGGGGTAPLGGFGGAGGAGSDGGYGSGVLETNGWDATAFPGDNSANGAAQGGANNGTYSDNGGAGGLGYGGTGSGTVGGGGGGGGGGYYTCIAKCLSSGLGGQNGDAGSGGGGGGAGGNSFAESSTTNVSFQSSGFSAGTAGQITLSYGAPSATAVSSSSATSPAGQSVRFVAAVDPSDGGGTVTFASDGGVIPGCSNLTFEAGGGSDWLTSCSTSALPPGTHTITATYSGDSAYTGSSASTTETVQSAAQATTTSLTAAHSTTTIGSKDKLTATVQSSDGGGTIAFTQGGQPLSGCGALPLIAASGAYTAVCTPAWSAPGSYSIVANYSGDSGSSPSSATTRVTVNPAPVVSWVSPNGGPTTGAQTVTITGSYLSGATKVSFGAVAATHVTVVSDSQVTATAPAHAGGTVNVRITSTLGTSSVSSADRYTYDAPPTVSSISPTAGPKGTVVTVDGTGFVTGAKVAFGTTPASKVVRVSSTELRATAPAGPGTVAVTVTTPGGTSATTPAGQFTYTSS